VTEGGQLGAGPDRAEHEPGLAGRGELVRLGPGQLGAGPAQALVAPLVHGPAGVPLVWDDPWSRAERLEVVRGDRPHDLLLFDEAGCYIDHYDVQRARLETVLN
jgi:hypothetical protein